MADQSEQNELRTRVDPMLLKKFEKLKAYYGVTETSEMLRLLISEAYRFVIEKDAEIEKIRREFNVDHKVPIFKGGKEFDESNLWTLCILCRRAKT